MAIDPQDTGVSIRAPASRTAACPCGSGRRYKDCHGSLPRTAATPDAGVRAHQLALQGLNAQQRQDLAQARTLYEQALKLDPDHADALHMLGVVHYELDDAAAAVPMIMRALDLSGWTLPAMRNNLGLALARLSRRGGTQQLGLTDKGREYREHLAAIQALATADLSLASSPTVSVVVPSYNHSAYLREALESVYAQTYRQIELIVVDDGSTDESAAIAREVLSHSPFPHQFVARDNRGAHATLNEAIGLSTGAYINPLNSDDTFTPTRIYEMLAATRRHSAALAFSSVEWIDAVSATIDPFADSRVYALLCSQSAISFQETIGSALVLHNHAITTGNLFFSRELFTALNGFRDFRYNHDWDFCLRALWLTEPVRVDQPLYRYRFHGRNTISESAEQARAEATRAMSEYLERAFNPDEVGMRYTPNVVQWREHFVTSVLANGLASGLPPDVFRNYAARLLAGS
jgi:glycosyltransferase involved in cell wall biosynthesis